MHKEATPSPTVASKRFIAGFLITGAVMAFLNLLAYLQSHGAHNGDGYEVIGFPLIFHLTGGLAYIDEFYPAVFLADVALALVSALLVGYACKCFQMGRRRGASAQPAP